MTSEEIAELYVEELTRHPARHGLDLWLSKGYAFRRLAAANRGSRKVTRANSSALATNMVGIRAIIADMRSRGATPAEVQRYVVTQTPFTLRQVFQACSDAFERRCYTAA